MDITRYRGIIGSLLYLTVSRSYIMFSMYMCAKYQASPRGSHFKTVRIILRYLNGTSQHGLWFPKGSTCSLVGCSDSDFSGCMSDKKSTSGICHLFGNFLVSWHSKKQHSVALSTVEVEYVVAGSYYAQVLWIK